MLAVYQAGIDQGDATFETAAPSWEDFTASKLPGHRHVAIGGSGEVAGWVAASPVSDRCVYAGVVEHSVYVHPAARGQGAGRLLLAALIASRRRRASGGAVLRWSIVTGGRLER